MKNEKWILSITTFIDLRLKFVNTELEYLKSESVKKYALNNPDELNIIKNDFALYSKEFDLLSQLSDFYSGNV
jgi:hypothetical protein